eukprot:CAMPEP_0177551330 /NCGR_PEP_ID=MMETSP0369-20130122/66092_1 /TAXON_ID=447022 ORGANISM="Scrippsiella hangoei-like, Strain SHHI-4" /NCGR_SAMPLE_ID=MMETSP0369 /ASSEMBLY_ACC=CAM_ASM_000364 /LENGTH=31 /DNA_ID= /DNA_START= /DNA_END= /DNA_ORIENTATION=
MSPPPGAASSKATASTHFDRAAQALIAALCA